MTEHTINLRNYVVVETSDLEDANADGSMTVPADGEAVLIEYEPQATEAEVLLHSLGAVNAADVRYRLKYGQNISNTMESPPGGVNEPYSYTNELGKPLTSDKTVQYVALNDSGSPVDLVARAHLEVVPDEDSRRLPGQRGI